MADIIQSQKLYDTDKKAAYRFTDLSDGTGESDVTKIDVSTLLNAVGSGYERVYPTKLYWTISGGNNESLEIAYQGANDTHGVIGEFGGSGSWEFEDLGFIVHNDLNTTTGDILFSTKNFNVNSYYTVFLEVRKYKGFTGYANT